MNDIEFVLCDLDGVVRLGQEAIPGAAQAVARIRSTGRRVLFVTNNSVAVVGQVESSLAGIGIPAADDVLTSAQAGASLVEPDERVLVCGGAGIHEAVGARGAVAIRPADVGDRGVDAVLVGLDVEFTFATLATTSRAIRSGARFVATNDDPTFPTPGGLTPGAGSIVAAVAVAAGTQPVVAGKPHGAMAALVAGRCGPTFSPDRALMVGDRWSTDGAFAATIGCRFALVRSGVTPPGASTSDGVEIAGVALDVADLAAVADALDRAPHG